MALTVGPRLAAFFQEPLLATVATTTERGNIEMTPIWYEYRDGYIWFNGDHTRKWYDRMKDTGRATFLVLDTQNAWRWVQGYGRVVEASPDAGGEHINRLAHRYVNREYPGPRDTRRWLKIELTSVKGADGNPSAKWDVSKA